MVLLMLLMIRFYADVEKTITFASLSILSLQVDTGLTNHTGWPVGSIAASSCCPILLADEQASCELLLVRSFEFSLIVR